MPSPRFRTLLLLLLAFMLGGRHGSASAAPTCDIATGQAGIDTGRIAYSQAGHGPPVLLLHGLFAQKEQWHELLCRLAVGGRTAIAPDLPGYGQSAEFPLEDYRLERQAVLLRQFMNTLGYRVYAVAGSSMGGTIAALMAQQFPREVSSVAFIGSPLGVVKWGPGVREAIFRGINPFIPVDTTQFDLEMGLLFVNPPPIPLSVKENLVKDYVARRRHYQQVWDIVNLYDDRLRDSDWLRKPTLIVWGRQDHIFSIEGAKRLKNRLPRGQLRTLPDAGHLLLMENAETVAAWYQQFLRKHQH